MSGKHRSLSEEAASMSEDDESEVELTASIKCHSPPSQITDLLERYYMACNKIINEVKKYQSSYPGSLYSLSPVVVARNVSPDCLAALPSFVKEYKVKSQVVTGDLYILELGISREHGRGVLELGGQARDWKNSHRRSSFVLTTDSVYEKGEKGAAPDLVISVHDNYKDDPTDLKVGKYILCPKIHYDQSVICSFCTE